MMRKLSSGHNMPPGCYRVPGDEEGPCAVCCRPVPDCVCDECPVCGQYGEPACYMSLDPTLPSETPHPHRHGMHLTRAQLIGRYTARRDRLAEQLVDTDSCLKMLTGATPDSVIFSDESPFSRRLCDNPDPWR